MAKNENRTRDAQIVIAAPVPVGTVSGDIVIFTGGLTGWATTDRITQAYLDDLSNNPPQGLADGEASVELIDIHLSVTLTVAGTATFGAKVYDDGAGGFDLTSTANAQIGYALEASPSAGAVIKVGLSRA